MAACQALDSDPGVDVIVVARGGGSLEDLLPFSDEALIRCIHQLTTAVVSAIGHEQDSPLLDLVADLRASTPTDAARRVVPDVSEQLALVGRARDRLRYALRRHIDAEAHQIMAIRQRSSLRDPRDGLDDRLTEITLLRDRSRRVLTHRIDRGQAELEGHLARVRALSPLATLRRGYAVVSDADGQALSSVSGVESGATIHVRVADGRITATTETVTPMEDR
jgi:exodeoxyribonuclease VII large subunit